MDAVAMIGACMVHQNPMLELPTLAERQADGVALSWWIVEPITVEPITVMLDIKP